MKEEIVTPPVEIEDLSTVTEDDLSRLNMQWPENVTDLSPNIWLPYHGKMWWSDAHSTFLNHYAPRGKFAAKIGNDISDIKGMLQDKGMTYRIIEIPNTVYIFPIADYKNPKAEFDFAQAMIEFEWNGVTFQALSTPDGWGTMTLLFAPNMVSLQQCAQMIASYRRPTEGVILMFNGEFSYNKRLKKELQRFTWDDVVLPDDMMADIKANVANFFDPKNQSVYELLNVPYKRGMLFCGEPGSGKSLVGKVLANTLDYPFIYVTNLMMPEKGKKAGIEAVFETAEEYAPCVMMFEDLDSQIDESCRTDFLNALDGFKSCEGVLCLATTNHPGKIDQALTDRPSRFDRKIVFKPLDTKLRYKYLINRVQRILQVSSLTPELHTVLQKCAKETAGQQVAYLQELVITASISWVSKDRTTSFIDEIETALAITKKQSESGGAALLEKEIQSNGNNKVGYNRLNEDVDLSKFSEEFEKSSVKKLIEKSFPSETTDEPAVTV